MKRGTVVEAGPRVVRAFLAVPRWIVALVRPRRNRRDSPSDRSTRRGPRSGIARTILGLLLALAATAAALVLVFALARAIYYPFWAAGATHNELERSWGGPSAVGATLVHWLVAAVTILVMYGVIVASERLGGDRR